MGIPSYYKKLSDKIKGLIARSRPANVRGLYFDFNCMIYHCARRPNSTLPPYPGDDGKVEWENMLLDDIVKYIVKVWHDVGQPKEVFLAIDGVVPMAKIRQQRLRRFKSIWLAEEERKAGTRENKPSWDTNCITPGTAFMRRLTTRLTELCEKRAGWRLSGAEEPGEGEHKIMKLLRQGAAGPQDGAVVIYGLDADLILLTLLNTQGREAYLVREDSEMGVVQTNSLGEETFSYFSLEALKKAIWTDRVPDDLDITEYVAAMSLLGNDFVPHSLTVKIRDDGHNALQQVLAKMRHEGKRFVEKNEDGQWKISYDALMYICKEFATTEYDSMVKTIKKKLTMRNRVEANLDNKPIEWGIEQPMVIVKDGEWNLVSGWQEHYNKEWISCDSIADVVMCCLEYAKGLQWVLDYYTGQRAVNMKWYFPRTLPPLWSSLVKYLELRDSSIFTQTLADDTPIREAEQLAMVLPLESWHLLEDKSLRLLPTKLPHYWPTAFSFFSAGRTRMWECEPLIPLLPVERVRLAV